MSFRDSRWRLTAPTPRGDAGRLHIPQQPAYIPMDITEEQLPPTLPKPPTPEKGLPPEDGPDTGARPDLKNPETPDEEIPGKPISDMDPPGQDEPENPL